MYSLCVLHHSDLIVFIYQVWVGNCMCVFPVISPLFIQQNVLSLSLLENVLKAKDQKKRRGCFYPHLISSGEISVSS